MSGIDGTFERIAILSRMQAFLLGGRAHDGVPDDARLERDEDGQVKPYAVLHLGTIYALPSGRTLVGEEEQPHVMPFTVQCYAADQDDARAAAAAVRTLFVGWQPSPGSEEISAPGGSSYRDRDAAGTPTLFVEAVALETVINMGSNEGYVPTPGGAPGGTATETIEDIVRAFLLTQRSVFERHDFRTPVGQWSGEHALARIPSLEAYSLTGQRLITDTIVTETTFVVTWANPTAGFVILT